MFLLQQQQRCSGHHTQQLSNPISSCGCVFITAAAWAGSLCCVRHTPLLVAVGREGYMSVCLHALTCTRCMREALCIICSGSCDPSGAGGGRGEHVSVQRIVFDVNGTCGWRSCSWISHHAGKKWWKMRGTRPRRWTALSDSAKKKKRIFDFYIS